MNNNVVEKTLKSIDNIDRLSDLAAISIYNTSHEAIDKFDVMQEHATPEYVEGEFVQESLLTGVLIGAGIIGVAISAFLIIKKIIESKAKGDPNAAPNTPEGADLTKPEDIQKLFDKWKTEYFNKYPDLVVENVKCADARQMSEYATLMTDSVNQFTDRVNIAVDEYMDNGSEEKFIEHINDIAATIGGADISAALSSEGRIDQSTIGNLEVSAVAIAKSFKEFDGIIKNNIANFEKKAKEKNDKGTEEEGSDSRVSEKTIKQFSDILKKKAEETGKIMVSFRKNVLGGFEAAIKAAANEKASSQTKQQTGNAGNGLTDEEKQRILNIMKVYYPEDEKQINDEINVFDAAESADELKKMLDESYEELKPGKGVKNAFIRIADVAEQVAAHKHFDWPIRADNYDLDRLDSEDTDTETDTDINAEGPSEGEPKNQNTDEASAETETSEGTPKAEPATAGESDDYDPTQYIDKNRANEAAARESTEEFGDDSSEQSTAEQPENQTGEDNIREIVQRLADQYGFSAGKSVDVMINQLSKNNNDANALRELNVDDKVRDKFNKFVDAVAKELGQDVTDETSRAQPEEAADNSEPVKPKKTAYEDDALKTAYADKYFNGDKDKAFKEIDQLANYSSRGLKSRIIQRALYKLEFNGNISAIPENIKKVYTEYEDKFNTANISMPVKSADDVLSSDNLEKLKEIIELTFGAASDNLFVTMMASIFGSDDTAKIDQVIESLKEGRPYYWPEDPSINIDQKSKLADIITKFLSNGLSLGLEGEEATKSFGTMQVPNIINLGLVRWAEAQYAKKPESANNVYRAACEMATALQITSRVIHKPGNNGTPTEPKTPKISTNPENKTSAKTDETSNAKLFTDEEEDKITNAVYEVKGLDRKFRQEIYNAVTDDGFAEAAKKLYDKYADDANKLKQINTTLIAMAKSIGKESEVPALPTTEATPTEAETSAENQTPEQTETPTETPEGTPEAETPSDTAPGVVTDNEELKKIADDLGLPLGNFISAYDKVKEGNADYTESQMLTTVFNNQIAFNQFTLPAINEAIAKEYDKCKQVADAVHAPFDIEPITIDDATFKKLYAYFDQKNKSVTNMETAKLIPGALADMVMDEMRSSEMTSPEASENTETGNKTISVDDPVYMEKFNEAFSKAPDDRKQGIIQSIKSVNGDLDTYLKRFYHRIDELKDTPERKAKFKNGRYNSIKTLAGLVGYTGDLTAPNSPRRGS